MSARLQDDQGQDALLWLASGDSAEKTDPSPRSLLVAVAAKASL